MRLLLVEDNQKMSSYLKKGLVSQGYAVDCFFDGISGEKRAESIDYDLIILDIMLPYKDGISVCKSLREGGLNTPVIMLTAKGGVEDRILGLDSGADDYLVKPFEFNELTARIRALLRRPKIKIAEKISVQDLLIDVAKQEVTKSGKVLNLTTKEYAVLLYLVKNKEELLTRDQILTNCWDWAYDSFSNIVDVFIKQIRKKLEDKNEKYIQTIRGAGYKFRG